ncbi:molybdopterin-dependent oxidoreductase [Microbulbifer taiwanensis]|uniref:molybdopterin-dependent oxidoreductase n=1 Tax=Microbulbifer taiwanensis TaxID=986746 RepID=UPI0036201A7F
MQRDDRIHSPSTPDIENADAILILGEDLDNTAPRISLAVRQAARNRQKQQAKKLKIPLWQDASVRQLRGEHSPVFFAGTEISGLADVANATLFDAPGQIALFADAIAQLIQGSDAAAMDLAADRRELAMRTADTLLAAKNPLIISGCSSRYGDLIRGAGKVATAIANRTATNCALYLACPEVNSLGLAQFFSPGRGHLEQLTQELHGKERDPLTLVVLENDLYRRADPQTVERILSCADEVILLDSLLNSTVKRADLIFPAAATAESQGSYINSNGQTQRFYAVYEGGGYIQESWRWLADAASFCEQITADLSVIAAWQHSMDLSEAVAAEFPTFEALEKVGPDEDYRIDGLKVARQGHRYSGRTAVRAKAEVAEFPPHLDPDAPMAFSMEGIQSPGATPLSANIWSPGWNSNQSIFKFQQGIGGARKGAKGPFKIRRQSQSIPDWTISAAEPEQDEEQLITLPIYRMFGSDELSASAAAIASVIEVPFALINRADAERLGVQPSQLWRLHTDGNSYSLRMHVSDTQPPGTLGVPCGLPGLEAVSSQLPGRAQLKPLPATETGETP